MVSSRCLLLITLPYSCLESREGLDIALMASFTPRICISILWCSHTITIDKHNVAVDIITIQKRSNKMSCYSKFDRTLMS